MLRAEEATFLTESGAVIALAERQLRLGAAAAFVSRPAISAAE